VVYCARVAPSAASNKVSTTGDRGTLSPSRLHLVIFGVALLIGALVTFVLWNAQSLVATQHDPYGFEAMGKSVANGEPLSVHGTLLHRRSPLFALFIGAVYSVFGEQPLLIKFAQLLAFAGMVVLVYDLGRRLYNPRTGLIAAAFCALHPSILRYVPDFHVETTLTFLFTLSIWCSVRLLERPNAGRAVAFGVTAGLASLAKAVVMLYPLIFGILWLLKSLRDPGPREKPWWSPFIPLSIAAVCMALTIAPWTVRNYQVTGHFVPVTTGMSDAFLRGFIFAKTEYITLREPPYTGAENEVNKLFSSLCAAEGTVWERDDVETDRILNKAAKAQLLQSPGEFVRKSILGVFTFWYEMTSLKTSLAAGGMALGAWVLAIIGLRRSRREGQRAWTLLAPILFLNLLLAVLLALGRYSVPILPCLMVLAAFGADTLLGDRFAWARRTDA
jgi:4-amino-4-deoxy-L-arabinose transferase-like glycosyltransferase